MWTDIISYIYWSPNQISISTGCSKNYNRVKALEHHWAYITMAKHTAVRACALPSNSSVQQPDSQVNNCSMCRSWTCTTAFNRGRHWSTALLHELLVEAGPTGAHSVLEIIQTHDSSHRTAGYSCQLFNISGTFAGPRVVFPTAYQFSYTFDILFHSDSPRPSATGLPRDRVLCVNLAQKISNRTDCSLLVRKLFTNTSCTTSFFLVREFNRQFIFVRERHVYQQTVT